MNYRNTLRSLMVLSLSASFLFLGKFHATIRGQYDLSSSGRLLWIFGVIAFTVLIAYAFGLPEKPSLRTNFRTAFVASISPVVVVAIVQTLIGEFVLPRMLLVLSVPINSAVLVILAVLSRRVESSPDRVDSACLLVTEDVAERITHDLASASEIPVKVAIRIPVDEPIIPGMFLTQCLSAEVSVVVVLERIASRPDINECLSQIHGLGVKIRTVTSFYDNYVGKVLVGVDEVALPPDDPDIHRVLYSRTSRAFDVCVALIGMLAIVVLFPIVVVGNLLGNRGPIFYSQDRVGKGGSVFRMHKFRSMAPGGTSSQWTSESDPRVTSFGRLLRLSHVDELPQFWNIMKGDLSLIGPRPEQPNYVEQLNQSIPRYGERHLITPGLTGWAQVNYPYGASERDSLEKLQYDLWYIKHQRLWVDVKIIARTLRHVAGMGGR